MRVEQAKRRQEQWTLLQEGEREGGKKKKGGEEERKRGRMGMNVGGARFRLGERLKRRVQEKGHTRQVKGRGK